MPDVSILPDDHLLLLLDLMAPPQYSLFSASRILWLLLLHVDVLLDVDLVSRLVLHLLQVGEVKAYPILDNHCVFNIQVMLPRLAL